MTCPNCGQKYERGNNCPHCNTDAILYNGAVRISDTLYNKGLAKIKVSDLSGAIDYLSRSISINKNNTQARNLLGLVQYEIGHIGEALKNWVISCGLQRTDNPATGYIDVIQRSASSLERFNDAIRIYNQALKDLRQQSDDMALIKLKQATELNPKFIDALNLLSLCYFLQKDKARAIATAERVLSIDAGNVVALSYYNELSPSSRPGAHKTNLARKQRTVPAPSQEERSVIPYKKVVLHERRNVNFHLEGILALVIGVICTIGVMYVLVFPALGRNWTNQIEEARAQLVSAEQAHEALLEEKNQEISELLEMIDQYSAGAEEWAERYDALERTFQILNAFDLLQEDRLQEAADALGGMGTEGLAPDIVERANEIRAVAYPPLAQQFYAEGFAVYHDRDFERARTLFERAYRYAQHIDDPTLYSNLLYYLGWTFSWDIDIDRSINYFNRLLEEFPDHRYIEYARNRLYDITSTDSD